MRKAKRIALLFICLSIVFITICIVANAEDRVKKSLTFLPDTTELQISGTVTSTSTTLKPIQIAVYRPDKTPDMILAGTATINNAISFLKELPRDANGYFSYKYKLNDTADIPGFYTVYFIIDDINESTTVYMGNVAEVKKQLDSVNAAKDKSLEEKTAVFNQIKVLFNINTECYDRLPTSEKDKIISNLLSKQYALVSEIQKEFINISAFALASNAVEYADIRLLIEKYNDIIKVDLKNEWYVKFIQNDDQKNRIYELVKNGGPYLTLKDISDQFQKGVILEAVNANESPGQIFNIISDKKNSELLDLSFVRYNALKHRDPVLNKMSDSCPFSSIKDIVDTFNDAVTTEKQSETKGSIGSKDTTTSPRSITPVAGTGTDNLYTPPPKPVNSIIFSDLRSVPWAQESINGLSKAAIVKGDGTEFKPNDNITREEFVKMLFLSANLKTNSEAESIFTDVNENDWYYPYIASAEEQNLINGISSTTFGVGKNITRQDIAVMIVRLVSALRIELPLINEEIKFKDDNMIQDYAKVSVYTMQKAGIINGYDDGTFASNAYATRAEAAKIVYQIFKLIMK